MKYRLITKHKTGHIITDKLGIICSGGDLFRTDLGKTIKQVSEKYFNKKFQVRLEEV